MSMIVLQNESEIINARRELISKGASSISSEESPFRSFLRRHGLIRGVLLGDNLKSWDVLATLNFIEKHLQKNEPILDIG